MEMERRQYIRAETIKKKKENIEKELFYKRHSVLVNFEDLAHLENLLSKTMLEQ